MHTRHDRAHQRACFRLGPRRCHPWPCMSSKRRSLEINEFLVPHRHNDRVRCHKYSSRVPAQRSRQATQFHQSPSERCSTVCLARLCLARVCFATPWREQYADGLNTCPHTEALSRSKDLTISFFSSFPSGFFQAPQDSFLASRCLPLKAK